MVQVAEGPRQTFPKSPGMSITDMGRVACCALRGMLIIMISFILQSPGKRLEKTQQIKAGQGIF